MEENIFKAYAEVDKILSLMEIKYIEKIPIKLINFFKKEKLKGYEPNINENIPLDQQNLQKKTLAILAMINLNYWCETEEEKNELIKIYKENDKKKETELKEKYNTDNLFKNRKKVEDCSTTNEVSLIEHGKQSFASRIFNKIKKILKIK